MQKINQDGFVGEAVDGIDAAALLLKLGSLGNKNSEAGNSFATLTLGEKALHIKTFAHAAAWKKSIDSRRGSPAKRSWQVAHAMLAKGVPTAEPVAYLETDERHFFVTEALPEHSDFRLELIRLFNEDPDCEKFMKLLQVTADAVRQLHDQGFLHNDLGNQNIMLKCAGEGQWTDLCFIDLNRCSIFEEALSIKQRARDLSRIYLPSDLRRVFYEMIFYPDVVPESFKRWEKWYRRAFALHTQTRKLRHPIRERKRSYDKKATPDYPPVQNMWIWDARSQQPIPVLKSKDRLWHYAKAFPTLAKDSASIACSYRNIRARGAALASAATAADVTGKTGLAISLAPQHIDQERDCLADLGVLPLLVRFYAHEDAARWAFQAEQIKQLHEEGYPVLIALVQDRASVLDAEHWKNFLREVLSACGDCVEGAELGHAVNRVKWGCWNSDEYLRLVKQAIELRNEVAPNLRFVLPPVIDFEPHAMAALVQRLRGMDDWLACGQHLYVDRRGAPENKQGGYDTKAKAAFGRAAAEHLMGKATAKYYVTEVNWPLAGTGVYSPVVSPYDSPGPRKHDPNVSEEEYADYMIRYFKQTIGSGLVDRVYWWQLIAKGFGLIDEEDYRKRPAYFAFKDWVQRS